MTRVYRRVAALVTTLATLSLGLLIGPAYADAVTTPPGAASATGWYLALGDSVAAGYQFGLGDDPKGGYVGHVLDAVRQSTPKTQLRNLACSGETSTTLVNGGKCSYEEGSQLAQALVFLHAHASKTRLVTVTIGGNDVKPCLNAPEIAACVQTQLGVLAANLQLALSQVHAAAPGAKIVVTNYYNPYLAVWFTNPTLAALTSTIQTALNSTIASVTSAVGATADVATAFKSTDTTLVGNPPAPTNVAMICTLTWMCTQNDDHPNDAGYAVMATAVVAKL